MRRIEQFLVAFAALGVTICLCNMHEGLMLVIFALPALAAFYALGGYFVFRGDAARTPRLIVLTAAAGAGLGYCLLSMLAFFLRWIGLLDFLENTLLITFILSLIAGIGYSRTHKPVYKNLLQRSLPMLLAFVMTGIIAGYFSNRLR